MDSDIKSWVVNWFIKNSNIEEDKIYQSLSSNYLLDGWIDSFKFISFITDIEEHFNITFSNEEFQDRSFATIKGLSEIIGEKNHEKENRQV
jgi:acyl carrier protein